MSRIEKCSKCERPFCITEISVGFGGTSESEEIRCPHCGFSFTERSQGGFRTSKLAPDTELSWIKENQ